MARLKFLFSFVTILVFIGCAKDASITDVVNSSTSGTDSSSSSSSNSSSTTTGGVSGKITVASNGNDLAGATVYIVGLQSATTTTTQNDGTYSITSVDAGSYTLHVEKTGYVTQEVSITITAGSTTTNTNLSMLTAAYSADKYVITLTWSDSPEDLDARLYLGDNAVSANVTEVYWNNTGDTDGTLDSAPYAGLDTDDRDGYGPETISIKLNGGGTGPYYSLRDHRFYVNNYSGGTDKLKSSQAVVRVYKDSTLVKTYSVPTTGTGNYWHVFDLDSSGNFTDVNTIQSGAVSKP